MINIRRFVDRVTAQTQKGNRDLVMSLPEAQYLRDEIVYLLTDRVHELENQLQKPIEVTVKGGTW